MRRMTRKEHLVEYNKLPLQTRRWVTIQVMGLMLTTLFVGTSIASVFELLQTEPLTRSDRLLGIAGAALWIAAGFGVFLASPRLAWLEFRFSAKKCCGRQGSDE